MRNCPKHKRKGKEKACNFGYATIIVEENLDIAYDILVMVSDSSEEWILNSSCSHHMPRNSDQFGAYKCIGGEKIFMGNYIAYKAIGIDTIYI